MNVLLLPGTEKCSLRNGASLSTVRFGRSVKKQKRSGVSYKRKLIKENTGIAYKRKYGHNLSDRLSCVKIRVEMCLNCANQCSGCAAGREYFVFLLGSNCYKNFERQMPGGHNE